jgi:hypothetical protein
MNDVHDPALVDSEAFLFGPHGIDEEPDVDPIFAKEFERAVAEILKDDPHSLDPIEGSPETASDIVPDLVFRETPAGTMLFDGDEPVGGMIDVDIVLSRKWRGRGLGAEIVLESYMRNGDFRFWDLDEPAFSPAGLRTVLAAHRMGCDRDIFARKSARLQACPDTSFGI